MGFARRAVRTAKRANNFRCRPCRYLYKKTCDRFSRVGTWKNRLCRKGVNRGAKNCAGCFYEEELNDETFDQFDQKLDQKNYMEEELDVEDITPMTQEDIDSLNKQFEEVDASIAETENLDSEDEYFWGAISRAARAARHYGNRAVKTARWANRQRCNKCNMLFRNTCGRLGNTRSRQYKMCKRKLNTKMHNGCSGC